MREFIGLCMWCGCPVYSDRPVNYEGVGCNHEVQIGLEEKQHEDLS